jgi:outer membrane protein assembly factor BamB
VLSGLNGPPFYVVFDGSNQLWVLGVGIPPSTDPRGLPFASLALLGSDGRVVWQERFGDPQSYVRPVGLALTIDGHAVIALRVHGSLSIADPQADAIANNGLVASFNADGTRAWSRAIGQGPTDNISGLTVGADGTIYAAGFTVHSTLDPFLVALAEDGTVRWRQTYSLDTDANEPMLAARPCGGLVIAANTEMSMNGVSPGILLIDVNDSGQESRVRHVANAHGTIAAHGSDGIVLVGQLFGNLTVDSVQLSATGIRGNAFVARFLE